MNVIQSSRSRSLGQKLWYGVKGLVTMNTYVEYESPVSQFISYDQGLSFWKVGQTSRSRSWGQKLRYCVKGLEMHICNMKALALLLWKLWPRLKFLKSRSNFKVKITRSKIMVWCERSCLKEYTYEILKSYLLLFINHDQG